ncbi:helix-turn-helix domain-containing protein [Streptomyces sp. NBC_00243]|uniref:helix-turn-helix domain-containing protein n=1 Tax=Streptomyces sp. NBC_00243 TaxID=2975688 RepID=UPI002DD8B3C7|nr:helix-turn-helix transcriptional regulator [Streptomyces sp. NBC_00243]WRZ24338.1 helix-turn-helix domain-containing protein [Streptomyces sp. NBC_00243]
MPQPEKELTPDASPQEWFGAELRYWRKRKPGLRAAQLGPMVQVSPSVISKIEKGAYRCHSELAARLDDVLETGGVLVRAWGMVFGDADKKRGDADNAASSPVEGTIQVRHGRILGRDPSPHSGSPASVDRRQFLAAGSLAAIAPKDLANLVAPAAPPELPKKITPREIEQLHHAADVLHLADNTHGGGGLVSVMASRTMEWAVRLLSVRCPDQLQIAFLSAIARLGIVVGASHFDAYAHDDARVAFKVASECATEAGDWHLRAKTYSFLARQAIWINDPDSGLTYADTGLVRSERLTATERAMLHSARARAFGKMHDVPGTIAAVGQADEAFAHSNPAEDPPWMAYYDEAQHAGDTAHALYEIAVHMRQDPGQAGRRFETAVTGHGDSFKRSRAISRIKLASLVMAKGDPMQAVAIGHAALDDVGLLTSRRAADDLRELGRFSAQHRGLEAAVELRQRIRGTLQA